MSGSTREARSAGTYAASMVTNSSNGGTTTIAMGSLCEVINAAFSPRAAPMLKSKPMAILVLCGLLTGLQGGTPGIF